MINHDNDYIGITYKELISVIPKMSDEKIRELIAHLQLEINLRKKKESEG